jgi:predicted nucleic acid-binding protein
MKRVVLDTSVVVAALRTRLGAGNAVLRLVAERRLLALATPPLFLEYEDVLKRPEHQLVHGLAPEAVDEFLGGTGCADRARRSASSVAAAVAGPE